MAGVERWNPGGPTEDRRCKALSKQTKERCKRWAHPGKQVCIFHGARAGRKSNPERYAKAVENIPGLAEVFENHLDEIEEMGGMDLTAAGEITLLRTFLSSASAEPEVDMKIKIDMLRDLTRALQKEREIEAARENLVPLAKVRDMLKLAINTVTRFVPSASQEECWEELSRAMQPFNETITQDAPVELPGLPDPSVYESAPDGE